MASMNASGRPTALTKVPRPPRILSFATPDQVVGGEAGAVAVEDGEGVDGQAGGRHLRPYRGDRRALEIVGAVAGDVDDLSEAIDIASLDHAPPSQKGSPGGVAAGGAAPGGTIRVAAKPGALSGPSMMVPRTMTSCASSAARST
jgi:hypothetical protein